MISRISLILLLALFSVAVQAETELVNTGAYQAAEQTSNSVAKLKQSLRQERASTNNIVSSSLNQNATQESPSVNDSSAWMGMFKGLFLCLGVFFIGVSIYKRLQPKSRIESQQRLQILARTALSNKSQLVLASLDGKEVLVAVGSETVAFWSPVEERNLSLNQKVIKSVECGDKDICQSKQLYSV